MTLTLLLDLDDTLLDTHIDQFIPAYFQALSAALAGYVPPEVMLPALMDGTRGMFANQDPARTLREVFDARFYPRLGISPAELQPAIDRFYDEVFPGLAHLTRPRPEAVALVDWAFAQGYQVAITSNPLFPLAAIHHRLRWAGLPPETYPFALVTSYEGFHFTKSPAYFAEAMARLGWPDGPVLVVGDEPELDVSAGRAAGMQVFQVERQGTERSPAASGYGSIGAVSGWLAAQPLESLLPETSGREALVATLLAIPAGLGGLVRDIPVAQWTRCPTCDEWSLNEIMCHLRDVEHEVNIPRLKTLLQETNPFIAGQVTDAWVEQRNYDSQDGRAALAHLTEGRKQLVGLLREISPEGWKRSARHAIFGPTDLQELVGFIASHDRSHVQQVVKTIAQTHEAPL